MHLFGYLVVWYLATCRGADPPGHQKPLGAHLSPLGITLIGKFSTPAVFYEHFVKQGNPILMKQPLIDTKYPAMSKWNDYYLRERFGNLTVNVEKSKKERRYQEAASMTLADFLNVYRRDDVYMVQRVHEQMMEDVHVPYTLECGGFQRVLQDAVVWFSSGSTRSVLHYDILDNLLCVLDGRKEILLINKTYSHLVEADGFDQDEMYSTVDVDSVNMKQFPRLQTVPWFQVHMQAGDCLYIPFRWYHQVRSSPGRNLAINIWFSHLWWFDHSDCNREFNLTAPLSTFGFASPNEQVRSSLLEYFHEMDEVSQSDFLQILPAEQKQLEELFALMDRDKDSILTWKELYLFNIDEAVRQFPNVFRNSTQERAKRRAESDKLRSGETQGNISSNNEPIHVKHESSEVYDKASNIDDSISLLNDSASKVDDSMSRVDDSESKIGDSKNQLGDSTSQVDDSKSKVDDETKKKIVDQIKRDDMAHSELKSSIKVTVKKSQTLEKKTAEKKPGETLETKDSVSKEKHDEL